MKLPVTFLILALMSLNSLAEESLLSCSLIKISVDRLACYDALAQKTSADQADLKVELAGKDTVNALPETPLQKKATLGRSSQKAAVSIENILSTVTEVSTAANGKRIVKLANGQTWIENERGKRRINAGNSVTITKRRWRYTMQFESGPMIAVRPIN